MEYLINADLKEQIIAYYREAGMDYETWSPSFNMHFGFGRITTILKREKMLQRMTQEVFERLQLTGVPSNVADFGCGVGASMRQGVRQFPSTTFTGVTIVPWQKEKGEALNRCAGVNGQARIILEDYHATSLVSESYDGVYGIESLCYSPPELRTRLIGEMYRILGKGGRFVVADGFLKRSEDELPAWSRKIYKSLCGNWALPGMLQIDEFVKLLEQAGFKNVKFENVSWKVAPSVLHVPFVIGKFFLKKFLNREPLSDQSIRNLKGAFQTLLLGTQQQAFGYYFVSGEK